MGRLRGAGFIAASCITLSSALAGTAPGPATSRASAAEPPHRPNVVVVMADDMRFDELRFAPTVSRLARHGVTFANAFSSFPLCCPARASFLTGQHAHNHGVLWHEPPYAFGSFDDSRTIATSMQAAGYGTGYVGKYLNRYGEDDSLVTGQESWQYVPPGWTEWIGAFEDPGLRGVWGGTYNYFSTPYNHDGVTENHGGVYQTGVVGAYSRELARDLAGEAPFFAHVNFLAPHFGGPDEPDDPGKVPDARGRRTKIKTPARPWQVEGRFDKLITHSLGVPRSGGATEADVRDKPAYIRSRPELTRQERLALRELSRQRAEAILAMDKEIAALKTELEALGEWEDTVLVFTSDNGYYLGEHRLRQGKVNGHEPSLRVPLVMTGPGLRDGSVRYAPTTLVDLTATLLDFGGAAAPRQADGASRVPALFGADEGWTTPVLIESAHGPRGKENGFAPLSKDARTAIGVRTARYTYIRYRNGDTELYDLATDPHQMESLHSSKAHADLRRALAQVWQQLRYCAGAGCRAPLPDSLSTTADQTRELTDAWLAAHHKRYGVG
ncbi:hypothetical protein DDE18_08655 [Nocardioides gansuensis]|uniref:Sulfatase N-terminal domain-containing protein n=1 Tax=Nocardioides gansuensis TaxID=2138300 RepID=A0A2T8FCC4_9ACTN|nr:sulfatase [Nocardioides gansuensis]PVG83353.1 hypothetical protein DDE18_08655 [Nocardioides gansuensis]